MTEIMNQSYRAGVIPIDFLKSIFITIPKISNATRCEEQRTMTITPGICKILLHFLKARITPIIENCLSETQFGFPKGNGIRDDIHLPRIIEERMIQKKRSLYMCLLDYKKSV